MSRVSITSISADGTALSLSCNICGHAATVPASSLDFPVRPDGSKDYSRLDVSCPNCGSASVYPVSGGAAASGSPELTAIQQVFCYRYVADGEGATTLAEAKAHLKARLDAMDGADAAKWALEGWNP